MQNSYAHALDMSVFALSAKDYGERHVVLSRGISYCILLPTTVVMGTKTGKRKQEKTKEKVSCLPWSVQPPQETRAASLVWGLLPAPYYCTDWCHVLLTYL